MATGGGSLRGLDYPEFRLLSRTCLAELSPAQLTTLREIRTSWLQIRGMVSDPARGLPALLALVAVLLWLFSDRLPVSVRPLATEKGAASQPQTSAPLPGPAAKPTPLPPITVLPAATALGKHLENKTDPTSCLQTLDQLILLYRRGIGENPVGQNEDIVSALLGDNPKRAAFLPADSPAIRDGKLIDPWGTPYWFHPISAHRMEIRSAGPDRSLFTSDDLKP